MSLFDAKQDQLYTNPLEFVDRIRVLEIPQVRVSSASIASIIDDSGRYGLVINKNSAEKGERVLTPIGGGIERTTHGFRELQRLLGVSPASFENGKDLRFIMRGADSNIYRKWFLSRIQREVDPLREIVEELVDETSTLVRRDLSGLRYSLAGYHTELAKTSRAGQEGQTTLRLLEVFDVTLQPDGMSKLQRVSERQTGLVRFVTKQEIINRSTIDGIDIGSVALSLLNPQPTIHEFI